MKITTLCYIEHDGQYLMLHRIKKENDINEGKWIGVGGHAENGESPEREILYMKMKREDVRNVAIIAHVDHGRDG